MNYLYKIIFSSFLLSLFVISCISYTKPNNLLYIVYPPHITKPNNVTFDFNDDNQNLKIDFKPAPNYGANGAEWARFNPKNFENVEIKDGNLVLRATYDKEKDKFTTGAIFTRKEYGIGTRITVRAKIDKKIKGAFPAIWLNPFSWRPTDGSQKLPWPYNGEIDLFEYNDKQSEEIPQTIHSVKQNQHFSISKYTKANAFEWHIYTCDILEDRVILYLDEVKTIEYIKKSGINYPFDYVKYNLVLNSALHKTWGTDIEAGDNRYHLPYEFLIDWIHIENINSETGEAIK